MTLSGQQLQQHARDIAVSLDDVTNGRPFTPHLEAWKVHDKVFLIVTDDDPELQIITVKVDPHQGDALRRDVDSITSGRYFNKRHWITLNPGGNLTTSLVDDLVTESYLLVVENLPRAKRPVDPDLFGKGMGQ